MGTVYIKADGSPVAGEMEGASPRRLDSADEPDEAVNAKEIGKLLQKKSDEAEGTLEIILS
jgi:hypothetical protein